MSILEELNLLEKTSGKKNLKVVVSVKNFLRNVAPELGLYGQNDLQEYRGFWCFPRKAWLEVWIL